MFYVYVLSCLNNNELYIGSTNDLRRRIIEHNKGKVPSTRNKLPYKLVYYEAYGSELDARQREKMLKLRGQARNKLKLRLKNTLARN
jgi:putative endonuclease